MPTQSLGGSENTCVRLGELQTKAHQPKATEDPESYNQPLQNCIMTAKLDYDMQGELEAPIPNSLRPKCEVTDRMMEQQLHRLDLL